MGLTATVLGASGYAGGEVIRLLETHPALSVVGAGARAQAGAAIGEVHPHLGVGGSTFLDLRAAGARAADVCFSCLPSGALSALEGDIAAALVIDLADDHRGASGWTYGLPEHARSRLTDATRIANPGCYPTASLLGLIPFLVAGVVGSPLIVDAMSGVSGAGKGLTDEMSFAALHGTTAAYGTTTHRHVPEIERGLASFADSDVTVSFTPHLVPMSRGLLVTARGRLVRSINDADALDILRVAYEGEPFVTVTADWPSTKSVFGTNRALLSAKVDERAGFLIVSAAIDNLGKGAAGQAIQNANLALGLEETLGLDQVAVWP